MPGGEAFTEAQRREIDRAVTEAEHDSGWSFSVEVGPSNGNSRRYAETLHRQLPDPPNSILIQVDPERRTLEIVTGSLVRRVVTNRAAGLAAVTMQSAFAAGDLTRGLLAGIRQLSALARRPRSLHTDTP